MSLIDIFALLSGIAAVLTASLVAFHPNILYAAVALTFSLMSVAGLYAVLGADFVAAAQLIIYVGGIIVVILFAIMMSENIYRTRFLDNARKILLPLGIGSVLFVLLVKLIAKAAVSIPVVKDPIRVPVSGPIGEAFIHQYALPFEYVSLVLLIGLIGAVVIARPNYHEKPERGGE
ncbi:MAG: NADH-quinone oxidoreductase subunit J [Bdellovibrionota bacterium]